MEAQSPGDYRPICLIHSFAKILAKMMARRITAELQDLIDVNQSAFIKKRSIHDNFKYVQTTAKLFKQHRIPKLLLKLDIAKAFDMVSWSFLLQILQHNGVGPRWRDWLSLLLSTVSTKVLLNGVPGQQIQLARGLRQGTRYRPCYSCSSWMYSIEWSVTQHAIRCYNQLVIEGSRTNAPSTRMMP